MFDEKAWRKKYHLNEYYELRKKMLQYLGGVCVVCGGSEKLEIHHRDRSKKSFNLSSSFRSWDKVVVELNKCELRCHQHHIEVHAAKHGTASMYSNNKCRCDACRLAWNAACKKWQASYRERKKKK